MRFVILKTDWWQCIAAGVPYLMRDSDSFTVVAPEAYMGPMSDRGVFETDVIMNPHRALFLAKRVFNENPEHTILYEAENLLGSPYWRAMSERVRAAAPRCEWWNYSATNSAVFGDTPAPLWIPLGKRPPPRPAHLCDLDVMFVGSLNPRRKHVLDLMNRAGLKVANSQGPLFGIDLFQLQLRCKVVLNMHYYTPGVFESFRVVPAVGTGARVISEVSAGDEGSEYARCVPYLDLVDVVLDAVKGTQSEPTSNQTNP